MKRSYTFVGLGAVGGLYGGRLAAAGHRVHFVVRSEVDEIRRVGLEVRSTDGDVALTVGAPGSADAATVGHRTELVAPADVVVVATKTTSNAEVADFVADFLVPGGTILVLQNGLGGEEVFARANPGATVLGGMCFVCVHQVGPGKVEHVDYGAVTLAQYDPTGQPAGSTPEISAVADDLREAGVEVTITEDLTLARWKKLMWNIPYNGLSVALRAGTDEIMADPDGRALVRELMEEVRSGAAALGRAIEQGFVARMLADTEAMTPYLPSMRLDYEHQRPLELDAIYRVPTQRAREAGAEMVRTEALLGHLGFLDRQNRSVPAGGV